MITARPGRKGALFLLCSGIIIVLILTNWEIITATSDHVFSEEEALSNPLEQHQYHHQYHHQQSESDMQRQQQQLTSHDDDDTNNSDGDETTNSLFRPNAPEVDTDRPNAFGVHRVPEVDNKTKLALISHFISSENKAIFILNACIGFRSVRLVDKNAIQAHLLPISCHKTQPSIQPSPWSNNLENPVCHAFDDSESEEGQERSSSAAAAMTTTPIHSSPEICPFAVSFNGSRLEFRCRFKQTSSQSSSQEDVVVSGSIALREEDDVGPSSEGLCIGNYMVTCPLPEKPEKKKTTQGTTNIERAGGEGAAADANSEDNASNKNVLNSSNDEAVVVVVTLEVRDNAGTPSLSSSSSSFAARAASTKNGDDNGDNLLLKSWSNLAVKRLEDTWEQLNQNGITYIREDEQENILFLF